MLAGAQESGDQRAVTRCLLFLRPPPAHSSPRAPPAVIHRTIFNNAILFPPSNPRRSSTHSPLRSHVARDRGRLSESRISLPSSGSCSKLGELGSGPLQNPEWDLRPLNLPPASRHHISYHPQTTPTIVPQFSCMLYGPAVLQHTTASGTRSCARSRFRTRGHPGLGRQLPSFGFLAVPLWVLARIIGFWWYIFEGRRRGL